MKWLTSFILVIGLAGCALPSLAGSVVAPGGVLYQDDFSDPSGGWPRVSETSGSMDYASDGRYQMSVHRPNYDIWAMSGYSFADARVEVEAGIQDGPQGSRYGLVCRYIDPQNFYFFVVTGDGYEGIGKVKQGVQTLLGQELMEFDPAINTGNDSNHMRFDCIGPQLTGYVNQQSIASVRDSDFLKGDAGLIVGTFDLPGVKVSFDNFIVYKP